MKKLFSVALCLVTVLFAVVIVQAENTVSVWSENVEAKNNRLFDIDIYVDCTFNLAAATFEISYDSSIMEYREVNTEIDNGMVKATDKNTKTKVVFLKSKGVSCDGGVKLFSAKFKAVSEGVCDVKISMYDCVDNNAIGTNDEASAQIKVTVSGGKSDAISSNDTKKKTDNTSATEEATEPKSVKYLSVANPDDNRKETLFIMILLMLVILGLMFYIAKLKKDKGKDTLNQPVNNTNDQDEPTENVCTEKSTDDEPIESESTEEISLQEKLK